MNITICKNCGTTFEGKFCNNCSQAADTGKINFGFLKKELQKTFIHFDSGFFYTTKKLFQNPGNAVLEYINGARVNHLRPFSYLIIIAGTYIILVSTFHLTFVKGEHVENSSTITDDFLKEHFANIQLFLVFLYSLISLVFFQLHKFNFYEFIVIHSYLAGQRILINICLMPLHIWEKTAYLDAYLNLFSLLLGNGLMIWTYLVLFKGKSIIWTLLKTLTIQIILIFVVVFVMYKSL